MVTERSPLWRLGEAGPRPAHFRPYLLKTFLVCEILVVCFYSGFEADFTYSCFNLLCVSCLVTVCTLQGVAKAQDTLPRQQL